MNITYLYHSGFLLELTKCYFLFDYIQGTLPSLDASKPLYVFVSHHHQDHYADVIFQIQHAAVHYVLSDDIRVNMDCDITFMHSNQHAIIQQIEVETLASTDEGVAFCLGVEGVQIFYAGDFHWWDWGEEDSVMEAEQMEMRYRSQLELIKGKFFDIAFLVADPRLQERYAKGAQTFLQYAKASHIFLMHMWGQYEIQASFIKDSGCDIAANVHIIHNENQQISIPFCVDEKVTVRQLEAAEITMALKLCWEVFQIYEAPEYSDAGTEEFYRSLHDEHWIAALRIFGAFINEELVGVSAVRSQGTHLSLFFVKTEYQGCGIGRLLLEAIWSEYATGRLDVHASPYAVPIYKRLGFVEADQEQVVNGIRFIPMQIDR